MVLQTGVVRRFPRRCVVDNVGPHSKKQEQKVEQDSKTGKQISEREKTKSVRAHEAEA